MERYIVGIGAANVDIYGKSAISIKTHYDHPGNIHTAIGGVTRNVIENLSLLGIKTKMIAAIGDDAFGTMIKSHCDKVGIDTSHFLIVPDASSSTFMQVMDKENDMYLALCDMSINENITKEFLATKDEILSQASGIVFDPSLNKETIEYILENYAEKVPIFIDPVSDNYALKLKPYIGKFYSLKPNKTELENLTGIQINDDNDLEKAAESLIDQGLKKIYVSLGRKGCFYLDYKGNKSFLKTKPVNAVNASGAGDAFFATTIYCELNSISIDDTLKYAKTAGTLAVLSPNTINPNLSIELIKKEIEENKNEL